MMDSLGFHASLIYRERSNYGKDGWLSKRSSMAIKNSSQMVERLGLWKTLEGHDGCVNSVLFSNNGDNILTGSDDTIIKIFDTFTAECVDSIRSIHRNNIFYAKDLPGSNDLEWIVSCAADGQVVLTNRVNRIGRRIYKHQGRAHRISIIPEEPFQLLSCGEDGACCLFDLREHVGSLFSCPYGEDTAFSTLVNNNQLPSLKIEFFPGSSSSSRGRPSSIYSVGVNPVREHEVAVAGTTAKVALFDLRQANAPFAALCPKHLIRHVSGFHVTGVKYSHDGSSLLASYNGENVYLLDPVTLQRDPTILTPRWEDSKCDNGNCSSGYLQVFKGHCNNDTIKQVNFLGGQSRFVISGSDCGHALIWDAAEGSLLKVLKADSEGAVNCLDTHPALPLLATSGLEHDAKLFLPIKDGDYRGLRDEGSLEWKRARRVIKANSHDIESIPFPTPVIKLARDDSGDAVSGSGSETEEGEPRTRRNVRNQWIMRLAAQFLRQQRDAAAAADQAEQGGEEPPRNRRRLLFDSADLSAFIATLTGHDPLPNEDDDSNAEEDEDDDEEEEEEEYYDGDEDVEFFEEELNAEEQARLIFGDTQPDNEEDLLEEEEVPLVIDDTTSTPAMVTLAHVLDDGVNDDDDGDNDSEYGDHIHTCCDVQQDTEHEMSLQVSPFPTPAHDMDEEVT